jgi:prepilin-type N-terminal cleavage/methylation domain-containing protein
MFYMKSIPKSNSCKSAFTLVEVMASMVLFGFLALGVSQITMLAFRLSYYNVYKTSAYSVMQGYIEQIKSLDSESFYRASTAVVSTPPNSNEVLQTRSISLLNETTGVDEIDDWLVANTLDPDTLSDSMDVVNHKQVVIDIDEDTGERQMMDLWIDVEIHALPDTPGDVYLIDVQFIYALPLMGGGTELTKNVYVRNGSRDYRIASRKMNHLATRNEGRLQLVTSLLNFEPL